MVFIDLLRNGVDDLLVPFLEKTANKQHYFPLDGEQTAANRFFLCLFKLGNGDDPFEDIEEIRVAKAYLVLKGRVLTDLNEEVQYVKYSLQQVFFYLIAAECAYLQLSLREGGQLEQEVDGDFYEIDGEVLDHPCLIGLTVYVLLQILIIILAE